MWIWTNFIFCLWLNLQIIPTRRTMNKTILGVTVKSITENTVGNGPAKFVNLECTYISGYGNKRKENPVKISIYDGGNHTNVSVNDNYIAMGETVIDEYELDSNGDKTTVRELVMIESKLTKTATLVPLNNITFVGSLIDNVESKDSKAGSKYATMALAFNSYHRKNPKWRTVFEVSLLNNKRQGEITYAARGRKGNLVLVQTGELSLNEWTNKDGEARSKIGVICKAVKLLSGGTNSQSSQGQSNSQPSNSTPPGFSAPSVPVGGAF